MNRGITIILKECVCQDVTEAENIWAPKLTYESRLKKKTKRWLMFFDFRHQGEGKVGPLAPLKNPPFL